MLLEATAVAKSGGNIDILAIGRSVGNPKIRAQHDNQLLDDESLVAKVTDQLVARQPWERVTEAAGGETSFRGRNRTKGAARLNTKSPGSDSYFLILMLRGRERKQGQCRPWHSYYLPLDYWPLYVSLKWRKDQISEYGLYTTGNLVLLE